MSEQNSFPLVKMENISKSFGKISALKDVDFSVDQREIVGLLGDNGAGKTTLVKTLVGIHSPDEGTIYFDGKKISFSSPREARDMGIETVYQDLALVELMSISRNFFLGREPTKLEALGVLDVRKMDEICKKVLTEIGIRVRSTSEPVSHLSGGERQSIAISRAMHFGAKLLILDEPTAALSVKEVNKVLDYVREVREHGLSVIFITHNVNHVYLVADRFTILEHGKNLGNYGKGEVSAEQVSQMIATGKPL